MGETKNISKAIIIAVVVCAIILAVFIYGNHGQAPAQTPTVTTSSNGTTSNTIMLATTSGNTIPSPNSNGAGSPSGGSGSKVPPVPVPPPIIIRFITPVVNDVWKIGGSNPISWDNAANFTGEIDLLDGSGNFMGVVLSETGTNQTSYSWDTREYYLSRYSPLKKEVVPGTYQIRLKFDGNNLPPITSPVITVTN